MAFSILPIFYIISVITFIVGLKQMSDPATARKGNLLAGSGMVLAVLSTLFLYRDETGSALGNYVWIFGGLLVGGVLGIFVAKKVKMTAMPEMVSLFNGMGGASAALISIIEFNHLSDRNFMITIPEAYVSESIVTTAILSLPVTSGTFIILFAGLILGSITFAGSMIAWGKLSGRVKDFAFNSQHIINTIVLLLILGLTVYMITSINSVNLIWFYVILVLSLIYGVLFVMPIGGADMPVVISLLNSLSGISAACSGFLYNNKVILTGGILVGAAGTI
nr:NAD(P)(+) transhydrogenase (Re/Si-specific) subunit beta [Flavisolibacter sp.]